MPDYREGLVSIIIPTRGRIDTLLTALESVLNQTYGDLEVIIVDDNDKESIFSEKVKLLVQNVADVRVRLIQQVCHINGAAARNVGIKDACGEYIAFLDDDDWWEPEKLERQVKCLSSLDETYGLVTCLSRFFLNGKLQRASVPYKDGYICKEVASRCVGIGIGAPLIRRRALDETGYFDEGLNRMQDIQLFTFLCSRYKVCLVKEYLYCICGDDNSNRKNLDVLKVKDAFLKSIQPVLESLSKEDREFILIMEKFDMGYSLFKEHKYMASTLLIANVFKSPVTLLCAIQRVMVRIRSRIFKRYNLRKYK